MEDTLRVFDFSYYYTNIIVLILVLMEDTLRVMKYIIRLIAAIRLNPCFNGRYSQRV